MTYFSFLFRFLVPPLLVLGFLTWRDAQRGRRLPEGLDAWPAWLAIAAHMIAAVVYTTPWDNYLVATHVWWYEPELVSGIIIGWVPIEEYLFFVLQTLMTGLWLLWLARRLPVPPLPRHGNAQATRRTRWIASGVVTTIWATGLLVVLLRWRPGAYLGLELTWALAPVCLQLLFGADILWRRKWLVLASLLPAWFYLSIADFSAIGLGTWIIAPDQSLGIGVAHLPIEEILFFLLTNMLVVFGIVLVLARESQERAPASVLRLMQRVSGTEGDSAARPAGDW